MTRIGGSVRAVAPVSGLWRRIVLARLLLSMDSIVSTTAARRLLAPVADCSQLLPALIGVSVLLGLSSVLVSALGQEARVCRRLPVPSASAASGRWCAAVGVRPGSGQERTAKRQSWQ